MFFRSCLSIFCANLCLPLVAAVSMNHDMPIPVIVIVCIVVGLLIILLCYCKPKKAPIVNGESVLFRQSQQLRIDTNYSSIQIGFATVTHNHQLHSTLQQHRLSPPAATEITIDTSDPPSYSEAMSLQQKNNRKY